MDQPPAQDAEVESTLRADHTVQDVVSGLAARMEGAPVAEVVIALNAGLEAAGLPEHPAPWVDATARELAAGQVVVADARAQGDPPDSHGE